MIKNKKAIIIVIIGVIILIIGGVFLLLPKKDTQKDDNKNDEVVDNSDVSKDDEQDSKSDNSFILIDKTDIELKIKNESLNLNVFKGSDESSYVSINGTYSVLYDNDDKVYYSIFSDLLVIKDVRKDDTEIIYVTDKKGNLLLLLDTIDYAGYQYVIAPSFIDENKKDTVYFKDGSIYVLYTLKYNQNDFIISDGTELKKLTEEQKVKYNIGNDTDVQFEYKVNYLENNKFDEDKAERVSEVKYSDYLK